MIGGMAQRYLCEDPEQRRLGIGAAAAAIRRGALVVFPTDSAYAVACDAFSTTATESLRRAKGRPPGAALPALIAGGSVVDALAHRLSPAGRDLAAALWPGPLTLVARAQPSLVWDIADNGTVSVRVPLHPVALAVLDATGPLAATGANFAGLDIPLTCDDARAQLGDSVDIYLDAGPLAPGRASAVVDVTVDPPLVLRPGSVAREHLLRICPGIAGLEPDGETPRE